jgi:uncharacterized membrane protein YagU involved in acid resistance
MSNGVSATITSHASPRVLRAILWAGLVAGALDITFAFVFWGLKGVSPERILHGIAAGVLGPEAFGGGFAAAALGLLLHFSIAWCAAAAYCFAGQRIAVLFRRPVACGVLYGAGFYLLMSYVVVPLSATPVRVTPLTFDGLFAHTVLFGLSIALITSRLARTAFYPSSTTGEQK